MRRGGRLCPPKGSYEFAADFRISVVQFAGRKAASAPTKLTPAPEPESQQVLSIPEVPFRVIGETMDTYILVEQGESLLLIDKHAAHERVLFEKLKSEEHPVMPQLLLQPVPVSLTKPEAQAVLENLPLLQSLGFDVSEFADLQLVLRQIPSDLTEEDACATLEAFAEDLLTGKRPSQSDLRDNLLHTMACKAAIKAGCTPSPQSVKRWCARFSPGTISNTARTEDPCASSSRKRSLKSSSSAHK